MILLNNKMSFDEPNFKAFAKILSFMNDLKDCFGNDFPEITKYYSLVRKTKLDNHDAIIKQVKLFKEYYESNEEALKPDGDITKLNDDFIQYNDKFRFNLKTVIAKADKSTIATITKHLQVIYCVIKPSEELKTSLTTGKTKEDQLFNNLFSKVLNQGGPDITNFANLQSTALYSDIEKEINEGVNSGELSIGNILGSAEGLFSKIKNDAGDDPSIAPMLNMVQGLLMKAKSEM
jgi:hypothetical protein